MRLSQGPGRPKNNNPKRQWTLKLNTCKLSDMQENVHDQVLIGFKLLHLIDWEGFQSSIDHSLSEAK